MRRQLIEKTAEWDAVEGDLARRRSFNRHSPLWSYRMNAKEANHICELTHAGFYDAAVCSERLLTELTTKYTSVELSIHSLSTAGILSQEYLATISLTEESLDCSENQNLLLLANLSSFGQARL